MSAPHVMIDLETLSTSPRAAIISIGACTFTPETGQVHDTFYSFCSPDLRKYDVDLSTVRWWLKQDASARLQLSDDAEPLRDVLFELWRWMGAKSGVHLGEGGVWALPASFDLPILENAWAVEIKPGEISGFMWRYDMPRCLRTLCAVAKLSKEDRVKPGVAHDALSDCLAQVGTLRKAYEKIGPGIW